MRRPNEPIDTGFIFASPTDKPEPLHLSRYSEEYTKEYYNNLANPSSWPPKEGDEQKDKNT
jgi:hypothetical protein